VNILAWERALTNAARHGRISKHAANTCSNTIDKIHDRAKGGGSNHLVLCVDDNLFRDLESPEWGRPVGLGNVFVSDGSRVYFKDQGFIIGVYNLG
jgi:charged multivesicular body protein 7